jgi:amino acid permease
MSTYHTDYRKRILIFLVITGGYLLFTGIYTVTNLFFGTISWSDNGILYAYCTYAIWFNAYSYYRLYKDSVEREQEEVESEEWQRFYEATGLQPINHKKTRRELFMWTSLAVTINALLMIATKWYW